MNKIMTTCLALGIMLSGIVTAAQAKSYTQYIYEIGSNIEGSATDVSSSPNEYFVGSKVISWFFFDVDVSGFATLSIQAEGIDLGPDGTIDNGERDLVKMFYTDTTGDTIEKELGYLTQQGFYSESSSVYGGPGVVENETANTTSTFDLGFLDASRQYTFKVYVPKGEDGYAWVNEIETSTLTVTPVPEPTTMLLLGTGLAGLAAFGRKKRN